jgi:hypothetical protein
VAWWENATVGGSIVKHDISTTFDIARSVDVGDINGDGFDDVVAVSFGLDDVIWWDNNAGTGTGMPARTITNNMFNVTHVAIGNFDDQGFLDVVTSTEFSDEEGELVTWSYISGAQWTGRNLPMLMPRRATVADVDGDGRDDIIACSDVVGMLFLNKAANAWQRSVVDRAIGSCQSALAMDLDGQGPLELIFGAYWASTNRLWQQY